MPKSHAKTTKKQNRQGFKPGKSGNPNGRPEGSRNKATLALDALFDEEGEAITRKAIEKALEGDTVALRLCLERICPPRKSRPITLVMPTIETAKDVTEAQGTVIGAMAAGDITPDDANVVSGVLEAKRRSLETVEFETRLTALENQK
jgi:hypothetical protein